MRPFLVYFALTYIAALCLVSGGGHAFRLKSFRQLIAEHGVIPAALAGLIALGVCGFELFAGGAALLLLRQSASAGMRVAILSGTAIVGTAFWLYVRQLLRKPTGVTSCGCSPLSAPLTRAALAPSIGLVCIAVSGLGAINGVSSGGSGLPVALPCLWGATFAGMTILYPASVLQLPARREA